MVRKPVHATCPSGCSNITSPLYPKHRGLLLINPFNIIKGDIGCSGTSCGFSRNALNSHIILVPTFSKKLRNHAEPCGTRPEPGGKQLRNQVKQMRSKAGTRWETALEPGPNPARCKREFASFSLFGPLLKPTVPVKAARLLTLINPLRLCLNHRGLLLINPFNIIKGDIG